MEQLTANEKYHTLLCVQKANADLSYRLLKAEIKYENFARYDAELEQEIEQLKESIVFYDALKNKLEQIL